MKKDIQTNQVATLDYSKRFYNAGYYKLLASILNKFSDEQSTQLVAQFEQYDYIAFPIIYDFETSKQFITSKFFDEQENQKVAFLLLDTSAYYDPLSTNSEDVFERLSNSNYAFNSYDKEVTASALSEILELNNDGQNKYVFAYRSNPYTIFYKPLDGDVLTSEGLSSSELDETIFKKLFSFMSLLWTNSRSSIYSTLKSMASTEQDNLFSKFIDKPEIVNIFKIVGYVDPFANIKFQLAPRPESYRQLYDKVGYESIEKLVKEYPEFEYAEIIRMKRNKVEQYLSSPSFLDNLDFKSKVFIKTSNRLFGLVSQEEDFDFSSITIGYAKAFEREVNLSIVQEIRKYLHIRMPDFYNKYCNVHGNYKIQTGENFFVDFNQMKYDSSYLPPGVGQSIIAFAHLPVNEKQKINNYQSFIQFGKKVGQIRNNVAHSEIGSKKELEKIKEYFFEMEKENVFSDLSKLRRHLKDNK